MARESLHGNRILVTGASTGIGRALAVALANRGAKLAVAARRESLLRELAHATRKVPSRQYLKHHCFML